MTKAKKPPTRLFRVSWDAKRERYVAKNDNGGLLGADLTLNVVIQSAVREADLACREGVRVAVKVEQETGLWRTAHVAQPL
jgi:hypothetical protein